MLPYGLPNYVFGPSWFHGLDSVIEAIAIIVCASLLYYSYRCYRMSEENRFLYFSTAFLSLTLAFIAKILGTLGIYLPRLRESGLIQEAVAVVKRITIGQLNGVAFIVHIFFLLLGFMILFLIISDLTWKDKKTITLLTYMVIVSTWLGAIHYQLFYLTVAVLSAVIAYAHYQNYHETKLKKSLMVTSSFILLFVSAAFFMFSIYSPIIYVVAQVIQLAGFICMLIPFVMIKRSKPAHHGV